MLRVDLYNIEGVIHLENPHVILLDYMRLQLLCLFWNPEPERILIIGFGAGILPKAFHHLSPNALIDIVDIDLEIVDLAEKYFYFEEHSFIRIYIEDGRHFIDRQGSNQYDVIIIDVFVINGRFPHTLRTLECLRKYLHLLKSTGLVLANFPYEQESRLRQTYAQAFFKHIYRGISKNSYILIGLNKDAKIFDRSALRLRAASLQQSKSLPDMNWIDEIKYIRDGNDDKWDRSATIFTDKIYEDF
jgi:hypothetical protein